MVRIDNGMSELRRCLLKAGYPKQEPLKVSGFLLHGKIFVRTELVGSPTK